MNNDDIRLRLDQALASPNGVTLAFDRPEDAKSFRMACYVYRRRLIRTNKFTPYDDLVIRLTPPATILIEPRRPLPAATAIIPPPTPDQA